jgi:acyl-coenzyme A synthetase/AMP-(fatty) acid ligase
MLDAKINGELLANLIEVYKPAYIWCPSGKREDISSYEKVFSDCDYDLYKTNFDISYPLFEELALLLTTSGSTGSPKLVKQSYKNIQSNAKSICEYLKIDENERAITTLPMNYTYGLSIVNSHTLAGATMLLTDATIVSKDFWSFLKEQEATSFAGVPYTYEMLKRIRFFRMDLPSVRYFTQAGGKLQPELHREFAEYAQREGKEFVVMYGQTEATARMGYLPAEKSLEKFGSMGISIPGGRLYIIDVDGNEITEPEVMGELVYEGDNVTLGYAEKGEDLIKGDERFGRLETGDMAKFDSDGYFYIVGRKKRFLKLFGNRINLDNIDRMVKSEYPEVDVASTGTDSLMVIYVTDENILDDVKTMISDKTHINHSAIKVAYIEEIPRNESGKVLYTKLQ